MPRRRRLLVVNQYYAPGLESTGQLLTQLCEELARDYDVTVLTGVTEGAPAGRERRNGVEVVRVPSTAFERRRLALRALNYVTYVGSSLALAVGQERPDLVLCMSDPPFVSAIAWAVARRFGVPYVAVVQDVFPEVAVELGRLHEGPVASGLDALVRFGLARAARVVAIGETMRRRLVEKGIDPGRIVVIRNWVDTSELTPQPKDNEWARAHGLADRFVVMHSGNVGYAQNLDVLVRAATFLRDLERLQFVVIGSGARQADLVALAGRLDVDRAQFMPYQPREVLSDSLSTGDLHFVGLAERLGGYIVPSRMNGVLSVGRPVLVAADADSEIVHVVREADCGVTIPPGQPTAVASAIREAYDGSYDLAGMGERGREFVASIDRGVMIDRYRALFDDVLR